MDYVLYHASCWDGFCAAWMASKAWPGATFIPVQYGDEVPNLKPDSRVLIVDFSFPRERLEALRLQMDQLIVLDHHASARSDLMGLPYCLFDMDKSGARILWCWMHQYFLDPDHLEASQRFHAWFGGTVPWLLRYTEDRDLWRHRFPDTKEINAALRSYPLDFEVWDELHERKLSDMIDEGRAILRERDNVVASAVKNAQLQDFAGYNKIPVVNCTYYVSEVLHELCQGKPFAAGYFETEDARVYSLRSDNQGENVANIAKRFGGGGHPHAAGFKTDKVWPATGNEHLQG